MPPTLGETAVLRLREPYDYTSEDFDRLIHEVSNQSPEAVRARIRELRQSDMGAYLALGTAEKVAAAWQAADRINVQLAMRNETLRIYIIQPLYREGLRLQPRTPKNPFGENALLYKLSRFERITMHFPRISFTVLFVDDGCDGSGDPSLVSSVVARSLIAQYHRGHPHAQVSTRVIKLETLIRRSQELGWDARIATPAASRKGGSVLGGFAYARQLAEQQDNSAQLNVFIDYDADLSIHPDQVMLIAEPVVANGTHAAIASRRLEGAICSIEPSRNERGLGYIRSWRAMLPVLAAQVMDINRGLKAYSPAALEVLLDSVEERTFVYQVESLVALAARMQAQITEVPVSYIDSVALSTQEGADAAQGYDDQIERIREVAKRYNQLT